MLAKQADPDNQDINGNTVLHMLVRIIFGESGTILSGCLEFLLSRSFTKNWEHLTWLMKLVLICI